MSDSHKRTVRSDFRRFFVRGLAVLLPSILTLWLVVYAYQFVDRFIAEPINQSLRVGIGNASRFVDPLRDRFDPTEATISAELARIADTGGKVPRPEAMRASLRQRNIDLWWSDRWWMNLIGFAVAILGVYFAGRLVGGYVGRRIYGRFEHTVVAVPILRYVYSSIKQVVDFLISDERHMQFSRVVAVEYPRKGIWAVGLLTGNAMSDMAHLGHGDAAGAGNDSVTVFIPSSPTPFTGYTITVPRKDVRELPITIDEALRFVVSGGVLHPDRNVPPPVAAAATDRSFGTDASGKSDASLLSADAPEEPERPKMHGAADSSESPDGLPLRNGPQRGS